MPNNKQLELEQRLADLEDIPRQIRLGISLLVIAAGISSISISCYAFNQYTSQLHSWISKCSISTSICNSINPHLQVPYWTFPAILLGFFAILFGSVGAISNWTRVDNYVI